MHRYKTVFFDDTPQARDVLASLKEDRLGISLTSVGMANNGNRVRHYPKLVLGETVNVALETFRSWQRLRG